MSLFISLGIVEGRGVGSQPKLCTSSAGAVSSGAVSAMVKIVGRIEGTAERNELNNSSSRVLLPDEVSFLSGSLDFGDLGAPFEGKGFLRKNMKRY